MIFRNHLPKQDFRNKLDDNAKAFIVLQAVIMRKLSSEHMLSGDPTGPSTEYFERDIQLCEEIIQELSIIFSDVITENIIKNITVSVRDEIWHIGRSGS